MPHRAREQRRRRLTLRMRLTLWVVAVFTLLQLVTGGAFWMHQRRSIRTMFEQRVVERAFFVAEQLDDLRGELTPELLWNLSRREVGRLSIERVEVDVVDRSGASTVYSESRWPSISVGLLSQFNASTGYVMREGVRPPAKPEWGPSDRVYAVAVAIQSRPGEYLVALAADASVQRRVGLVLQAQLVGGLLGMLASAISGWFIAGIAVEPLHRLSGLADTLRPDRLVDAEAESEEGAAASPEVEALTTQLGETRRKLLEAFAAQERFLSNISHEIKTPIATLLLEAQTLDRGSLGDEAAQFVASAEEEMRKLGRLVESFLTLTRVRDGGAPSQLSRVGGNELVMEAVADCIAMAEQHDVRVEPVLASEEAGLDAEISGDPELLRTMANNLIRNAIRFTPRGGRVLVRAAVQEERFIIDVEDEGPGLPPELIDRVFDRFVQSTDEVRRDRGHGLGLAIAQGIAELHGGVIRVRNLEGRGAEFSVDLPVA